MIIARCYQWLSTDTISAYLGSDAGGNYAVAKIKDQRLHQRGKNQDKTDAHGFAFALTASLSVNCIEAVNHTLTSGELLRCFTSTAAAFAGTNLTANPLFAPGNLSGIFTQHGYTDEAGNRCNWIAGIDDCGASGPSATGTLTTFSTLSGLVSFSTAAAARATWELAFIALGIGGATIQKPSEVTSRRVALRHGYGWATSISWATMPVTDVTRLDTLWASTHSGSLPCFVFPDPGSKTSSGTITDATIDPGRRGGLVRLLTPASYTATGALGESDLVKDVRLDVESWQEVPTNSQ